MKRPADVPDVLQPRGVEALPLFVGTRPDAALDDLPIALGTKQAAITALRHYAVGLYTTRARSGPPDEAWVSQVEARAFLTRTNVPGECQRGVLAEVFGVGAGDSGWLRIAVAPEYRYRWTGPLGGQAP